MKSASILLIALLSGCACKPTIIKVPVEVKVLVPVPCLDKAVDKPSWPMDDPDLVGKPLFDKGNTALQEIEKRRNYERELEAAMVACLKKPA